jgi:hypothetical protein
LPGHILHNHAEFINYFNHDLNRIRKRGEPMAQKHFPTTAIALALTSLALSFVGTAGAADRTPTQRNAAEDPATEHHIQNVFIILMENHNWTGDGKLNIKNNPAAPYINKTLIPLGSHAENYSNPPANHPSLPNYLWLVAGTNFGILDDNPPSINHQSSTAHLVTLLENAGIPWKAYAENISGKVCPLKDGGPIDQDGAPLYGVRHNPFVYFDSITEDNNPNSPECIAHVRPFQELKEDLANYSTARFNFIIPNVCDDMHDNCAGDPIAHGDTWLSQHVPDILNSFAYQQGVLFVVWDEADTGDGPIPMIVLSPFANGHGFSDQNLYTHGSMLRTIEEIFGVRPFLGDAAREQDLSNMFTTFP